MSAFLVRRLLQAIPTLLGVTLISFGLMHAAPGDPITLMVYGAEGLEPEEIARLRQQLGLDQPLPVQYVLWLWRVVHLDLGTSFTTHEPVAAVILRRLGNTLQLTLAALVLSVLLGTILGLVAAVKRGSLLDQVVRVGTAVSDAVPDFWLGLVGILVFAVWLRLLPSGGMYTLGTEGTDIVDRLRHLAMPMVVLATGGIAGYARYVRTETLEVLHQEYVRTAYAKGLRQQQVLLRHVLKNALLPVITFLGGSLVGLFNGAVVIETVFSWPGMGRLGVQAVFQRDYPVLMGLLTIGSVLIVVGYLLADLAYSWADPRVRHQ